MIIKNIMVVIRDGKKLYTTVEMKERLNIYIEKTADELILELRGRRKQNKKVTSKREGLCIV